MPASIYLALHLAEGETITPLLLAQLLMLNPVLVTVWLFFGVGCEERRGLLSVPLLGVAKIVCGWLPGLAALGHMLGADKPQAKLG